MLAIERSTRRPGWALFRDADCVRQSDGGEDLARAPAWLARLGEAIAADGIPLASIDCLAIGLGPGSFSGIRAAIATGQGLALPGGCTLTGVSSAAALAWAERARREEGRDLFHLSRKVGSRASPATAGGEPVAVVGDARRNRLWCAIYARDPDTGRLCALTDGRLRTPTHTAEDFALVDWDGLAALIPADARVLSPDWDRIGDRLSAVIPADRLVAGVRVPTAADVGRLVLADPGAACLDPMPIYLQPAVAEER